MKKMFMASIVVLSCAIGVFIGTVVLCSAPCKDMGTGLATLEMKPGEMPQNKQMKDPRANFRHRGPSPEFMDSVLQVTPEQKRKLEEYRKISDSTNRVLFEEKRFAEMELRKAIENESDSSEIEIAKKRLLSVQEKMLDNRIAGPKFFTDVLSAEQLAKFKDIVKKNPPRFEHPKMPPPEGLKKMP